MGELLVDDAGVTDRPRGVAPNARQRIVGLPVGAELRIALTIEPTLAGSLRALLVQGDTLYEVTARVSPRSRFVSLWLRGSNELDLVFGLEPAGLS